MAPRIQEYYSTSFLQGAKPPSKVLLYSFKVAREVFTAKIQINSFFTILISFQRQRGLYIYN